MRPRRRSVPFGVVTLPRDAHGRRLTELARVEGLDPATGDYRLTPLTTPQPGDLP